jgi:cystathionine beta-lyase
MMWLGFEALGLSDAELFGRIVDVCGLGLGAGSHYGDQFGQYMRLNIGCAQPVLEKAMTAMCRMTDN